MILGRKAQSNQTKRWRRGEGVEPSGDSISRQAGFEDRWGHRAPSSSMVSDSPYSSKRTASSIDSQWIWKPASGPKCPRLPKLRRRDCLPQQQNANPNPRPEPLTEGNGNEPRIYSVCEMLENLLREPDQRRRSLRSFAIIAKSSPIAGAAALPPENSPYNVATLTTIRSASPHDE